jgi:hypothetical protein
MRSSVGLIFAVVLLAGGVLAQNPDSASTLPPTSTSTTPVSRSVELTPDASGTVPQEQMRELLRRAAEKDLENDKRLRDYTYIERQEEHRLDGHGQVKKVESRTSEILQIYGEQVERLTAKNDKPLSGNEARKEDEKIQKIIDKRRNESESDRRKRLEKEEKQKEEDRQFVREVADAFAFRLLDSEILDGRETWVLAADPRPGYEPKHREAKIMMKFKGLIWIDKTELQWVKLDLSAIDDISFGWVIARVHKGTHVFVEQIRVNDEVWLPKRVQFHLDAKLALLKNYHEDVEQTFRDYKKFRTDTKITVVGEETRE